MHVHVVYFETLYYCYDFNNLIVLHHDPLFEVTRGFTFEEEKNVSQISDTTCTVVKLWGNKEDT